MSQSRTLYLGPDVPNKSIAPAYIAQEHGAEVTEGDGKEQRKIPVFNHQAIDLPIKCGHVLRADSKSFPGPFWHNPNKINWFDSPTCL
jgi:hypothetical protein